MEIHFGQCKSSAEIFQAETCSKSCEDRTELINLFDRSTNHPLFPAVLTVDFSTDTLISLVYHLFNHVTFLQGCTAAREIHRFQKKPEVTTKRGLIALAVDTQSDKHGERSGKASLSSNIPEELTD